MAARQGVYGLILATAVIAISRSSIRPTQGEQPSARWFSVRLLAHVYARLLGKGVSHDRSWFLGAVARAMREGGPLVEVAIPLVLVLALGAIGVIPAVRRSWWRPHWRWWSWPPLGLRRNDPGVGPARTFASAMIALALGLLIVVLKVLIHSCHAPGDFVIDDAWSPPPTARTR